MSIFHCVSLSHYTYISPRSYLVSGPYDHTRYANKHACSYSLCLTVFLILSSSVSLSMNFLSLLSVIIIPMYMSSITNLRSYGKYEKALASYV